MATRNWLYRFSSFSACVHICSGNCLLFNWLLGSATSRISIKSILRRQINPLITKNRFRFFLWLPRCGLFKQKNPNKCTFISAIQIFHMFPWKISVLSRSFIVYLLRGKKKRLKNFIFVVEIRFSIWKANAKERREFPIDSQLKMSNDFYKLFPSLLSVKVLK